MRTLFCLVIVAAVLPSARGATAPLCTPSAVPAIVRAEGITERVGDILLQCGGASPATPLLTNLTVYLSARITNRLAAGGAVDASLAADTGSGAVTIQPSAYLGSPYSISFNGVAITPGASGQFSLHIRGIRVAASTVPVNSPILASLAASGTSLLAMTSNVVTVATPQASLLASQGSSLVNCYGSPAPETLTLSNLFARTAHATTRVTEAIPNAFEKRDPATMDSGVRIILRFSGFPKTARIFLPNLVAGSSATVPTTGAGLGSDPEVGQYTPSTQGSLLLARVNGPQPDGSGGTMPYAVGPMGSGVTLLDSAGEVPLAAGAGFAVFEVLDSDPSIRENAQIPVFLALPWPSGGDFDYSPVVTVEYAPVSDQTAAVEGAPVPRFIEFVPGSDCEAMGDCDAGFRPKLQVSTALIRSTRAAGSIFDIHWLTIGNSRDPSVPMPWVATIHYENAGGWIHMDPPFARGALTVRVDLLPGKLAPGVYKASIVIDAGGAGQKAVPVELVVTERQPGVPDSTVPVVTGYDSAAGGKGPLVPGSLAILTGLRFSGDGLTVTFDGYSGEVTVADDAGIQVVVPEAVSGKSAVRVVVTVNGQSSPPMQVELASAFPVIFANSVLNSNGSINSEQNPEPPGGLLRMLATGLPPAGITARIGDRDVLAPPFAGASPSFAGVQQVDVPVPADFGGGATVIVCAPDPVTGDRVCSAPALVYVTPYSEQGK
ncbi:MAG: hypothetical protein IT160_07480 [Bryobacterales bacterium]|nr:hypothetical protein [Bryobacterales bacterium]